MLRAAVATEYAYKVTDLPLSRQNVILYTYALFVESADGPRLAVPRGPVRQSPSRAASRPGRGAVAAQAASGARIGALLKYVDAIGGEVFADVIAMLITVVFRVGGGETKIYRHAIAQVTVSTLLFDLDMNFLYARAAALRRVGAARCRT